MRSMVIAAAALLLSGCVQSGAGVATLPAGSRYVAMGSSFAAGPGLGQPKPGTPVRCTRSPIAYPALLAQRIGFTLVDQTCSGATTAHIMGPWSELPPQIDAVTADTRLVTLSIGGNDLYYVGGLVAASCHRLGGTFPLGGQNRPCPPLMGTKEGDFAKVEASLDAIAKEVARRAPQARLVFVEYPRLVPAALCADTPLSAQQAAASLATGERLARITQRVARANGAIVIETDRIGQEHTPCSPTPWVTGFPAGYDGSRGAPWHPNAAGMQAMADAIGQALNGGRRARR